MVDEMREKFESMWALQVLNKDSHGQYLNENVRSAWTVFKAGWEHQEKIISEQRNLLTHYKLRLDATTNTDSRLKEAEEVIESIVKEDVRIVNSLLVTYLVKYGEFNFKGVE